MKHTPTLSSSVSEEIPRTVCQPKRPYRAATYSPLSPSQAIRNSTAILSPSQVNSVQFTGTCPYPDLKTRTHTHTHTHTHIYIYIYTHTHTHTQSTATCPCRKPYVVSPHPPILLRLYLFWYFSIYLWVFYAFSFPSVFTS